MFRVEANKILSVIAAPHKWSREVLKTQLSAVIVNVGGYSASIQRPIGVVPSYRLHSGVVPSNVTTAPCQVMS